MSYLESGFDFNRRQKEIEGLEETIAQQSDQSLTLKEFLPALLSDFLAQENLYARLT